ncbi:acyltransferase family protein [Sphingomonas sp. IC4-52]|uniref:acyltransferase family protein n=1 Tax=Sphingomonas sp. IC4-52 TaxID=2887202 RepID=UPI001D123490|nr:acyltransferase [Sphingomonas sp. IC4-52]MCC2980806.1 acyltransferase [Sphingomonas sp. IC4-52]
MRIEKLDALRGIAAIVVVVQHAMEQVIRYGGFAGHAQTAMELLFKNGMNFGRFGVAMFFVISGFVIPFSFRGARPLIGFAISRFFRLYPAYWISLAFALAVIALTVRPMPDGVMVAFNITMFQKFVGYGDVVGAYWTLAVELMFYILCAALFALGWLNNTRGLLVIFSLFLATSLVIGAASLFLGRHLPSGVPLHLSLMFLGTLMRRSWLDGDAFARRMVTPAVLTLIVAIPVIQWSSYPERTVTHEYIQPLAFTMGYYVAIAMFILTMTRRIAFGAIWLWFGAVSYSVYLLHGSFLNLSTTYITPDTPAKAVLFLTALTGGTLTASALVFYRVEKPFIRIGHRIMTRLAPAPLAGQ